MGGCHPLLVARMKGDTELLRALLVGMRQAYAQGENVMAVARNALGDSKTNELVATLVAYDLQAGSYVEDAERNPESNRKWCEQIGGLLAAVTGPTDSILEVGCGEATTLAGVLSALGPRSAPALGLDISWSRLAVANDWLERLRVQAKVFVADLFDIPLGTGSIDVVYTSHSLEPNGGREVEAVRELLRVSRRWVVLVEPAYELAGEAARDRMERHGYVRGLRAAAESCGATIRDHRLLDHVSNPLNPSGLLLLEKDAVTVGRESSVRWECPLTRTELTDRGDAFVSTEAGLVYPVIRGIPMLRAQHSIVASNFDKRARATTSRA